MTSTITLLSPELRQVLMELDYTTLTPVQEQCIPALLLGQDVIGQSKTGSGKTAAFALPLLDLLNVRLRAPQALVLCPTRELAAQVAREIRKLGRRVSGLQVTELAGGTPLRPQAQALQRGVHVVVGTPGRVLDHISRKTLPCGCVTTVVLDEADRMLDMGFEEDLRQILTACPQQRQTVLFSATFPPRIEAISGSYQKSPLRFTVGGDADGLTESSVDTRGIRQFVVEAAYEDKTNTLLGLLGEDKPESAIVFCNLKANVAGLATALAAAGVSVAALHGDLEQHDRDRVMAKFRNRSVRILVATDVVARGIDVQDVSIVFNFDLPAKPEVYVHRIGRTGRAGSRGMAVSLATPRERHKLAAIENYTEVTLQRRLAPTHPTATEALPHFAADAAMATLRISGGRKDKVRPGDILGALTGDACSLPADAIGKIEIHDRFAYVAVTKAMAGMAQRGLAAGRIKGRRFDVAFEA